jgi:hypothetical protein
MNGKSLFSSAWSERNNHVEQLQKFKGVVWFVGGAAGGGFGVS